MLMGPMPSGTSTQIFRSADKTDQIARQKIKDLEQKVHRLEIITAALWELIRDNTKLTDAHLEARIRDIDLRDGVEDGRITDVGLRCPACKRVSSSRYWKCLYCGQEFEAWVFK